MHNLIRAKETESVNIWQDKAVSNAHKTSVEIVTRVDYYIDSDWMLLELEY